MKLLTRYLAREIYGSIALVFAALLMLFSFFDLVQELRALGQGNYHIGYVLLFVLLSVPGHIYLLFPLAILIGTILALAQMAVHSELTVYRCSGVSLWQMVGALFKMSLPLLLLGYLFGELLAPPAEHLAQRVQLRAQSSELSLKEFRSGVWAKDERSFVNAKSVLPDNSLLNVSVYEFDESYHLRAITLAKRATFVGENRWQLDEVRQTRFGDQSATVNNQTSMEWRSALNPGILNVLLAAPSKMSAWDLYQYIQHLRDNQQKTVRHEIAMWNKLAYPLAIMVMLLLALPFAAHRQREGGISAKIFLGIVLGLAFHFVGQLFANLGALNEWQPVLSAMAMPLLFLLLAMTMLWWTERR